MDEAKESRPSPEEGMAVHEPADILIIGDQYHETATFEISEGDAPASKCTFPGGVWYVKRFLERSLVGTTTISTYPLPPAPTEDTLAAECIFKKFERHPDKPSDEVVRIRRSEPCHLTAMEMLPPFQNIMPKKVLVIEDMNIRYRAGGFKEWKPLLRQIADNKPKQSGRETPSIAVLLGGELEDLSEIDPKKVENDLWSTLIREHCHRTLVIVNADLLRFMGANISRRLSWERTAQDFVTELQCHPRLKHLAHFSNLIVRLGVTAAIHCFTYEGVSHRRFYYDPTAHDGIFRDVPRDGGVIGNNSVFLACALSEMLADNGATIVEDLDTAIKAAIPACQRLHHFGYPDFECLAETDWPRDSPSHMSLLGTEWLRDWPKPLVFDQDYEGSKQGTDFKDSCPTSQKYIRFAEIQSSVDAWSIVQQTVAGPSMMKLAKQIVFRGIRNCFNLPANYGAGLDKEKDCPRITLLDELSQYHGPIARFGDLTAVDREEIESFRALFNQIKHYITGDELKPLSIAVFGPPGSGKTFVVRQIANRALPEEASSVITINLSQLNSREELCAYLESSLPERRKARANRITKILSNPSSPDLKKEMLDFKDFPLLFFDGFDSDLDGKPLGWLKSFLSPMEEGIFGPVRTREPGPDMAGKYPAGKDPAPLLLLYRSIFVFAGGTKRTYRDFSGEDESLDDEDRLIFEMAKGRDFVSRLRAHINMKGIDRVSSSDTTFVLRRALMLRQHLKNSGLLVLNKFKENEAQIDYSVIHAMLHATTYKHGARSIEAVIDTCTPLDGRIEKASLPSAKLLDMHVNAIELHDSLAEYKANPEDPKPQEQTYRLS